MKLTMYDVGSVYDIDVKAPVAEVEKVLDEFDSGNSSINAFKRLLDSKSIKYKVTTIVKSKVSGFMA